MALAEFNLRQLLEAGVHFGHQTKRWNPLMEPYIYGSRNGIHILDLTQTVPLLDAALQAVNQTVAKGGIILFVGTKRQAQRPIAEAAEKSAQYYMNHRWLGGTLTNWKTVSNSISRLKKIDEQLEGNTEGLTKKERLNIEREQGKLQASLGGIRDMGGTPNLVFVIDTNKEALAIQEAKKLQIPVVAILDTNSNPEGIDFPIPGNDDASRSIALYCDLVARAALDGMESQLGAAGVDLGEKVEFAEERLNESPEKQEADISSGSGENKSDEKSSEVSEHKKLASEHPATASKLDKETTEQDSTAKPFDEEERVVVEDSNGELPSVKSSGVVEERDKNRMLSEVKSKVQSIEKDSKGTKAKVKGASDNPPDEKIDP